MSAKIVAVVVGFLGCIVAANYATTHFGQIPVGLGLQATAGTYFAGVTFVLRDYLHDKLGPKKVILLITGGAVLSFALSAPFIALASGAAFLLAELADLAVYAPLRQRGYIRAAVASNIVGSVVDTVVFLAIAGFPILASLPGQLAGKLAITLIVVVAVGVTRFALFRQSVRA